MNRNSSFSEQRVPPIDPSHAALDLTRRNFFALVFGALCAGGIDGPAWAQTSSGGGMQRRELGRTGVKISIIGLGGSHIGQQSTEQESIAIIRRAIDGGINFMDNCWDYHDGAMNDPDRIFAPGGAFEAATAARKAGKIRYLGFTGHKSPDIHLKMLSTAEAHGWTPDTVQMPLNVMDAHFNSFGQKVLPELVKRNIGVLGMKPMGGGFILQSRSATPVECLQYALSLPTSVVITGCDRMEVLQQALQVGREFKPLSKDQLAAILSKTAPLAKAGEFEKYKSSPHFDGTAHHPEWLGKAA